MEKVLVDSDQTSVLGFLNNKILSFSFLLGLKGNGKTLCITLKRYILQRDGVICIPKNEVLSKKANFTITTDLMAGINSEDCSSNIQEFILKISHYWQTAIYLTILQTVHEFDMKGVAVFFFRCETQINLFSKGEIKPCKAQ